MTEPAGPPFVVPSGKTWEIVAPVWCRACQQLRRLHTERAERSAAITYRCDVCGAVVARMELTFDDLQRETHENP
jgi:hypothetical protein